MKKLIAILMGLFLSVGASHLSFAQTPTVNSEVSAPEAKADKAEKTAKAKKAKKASKRAHKEKKAAK